MSHHDKLQWARKHLDALDRAVEAFLAKDAYSLTTEDDADSEEWVSFVERGSLPPDMPHLVGDCVYNLRASLDHLAHSLAERHPGSDLTKCSFPIVSDPKDRGSFNRHFDLLPPSTHATLDRLQPYNGPHGHKGTETHPLYRLNELNRIDKHRKPVLVIFHSLFVVSKVWVGDAYVKRTWERPGGIPEGRTPVARFPKREVGESEPEVVSLIASQIGISEPTMPGKIFVPDSLRHIADHIRDEVFPALDPFLT